MKPAEMPMEAQIVLRHFVEQCFDLSNKVMVNALLDGPATVTVLIGCANAMLLGIFKAAEETDRERLFNYLVGHLRKTLIEMPKEVEYG